MSVYDGPDRSKAGAPYIPIIAPKPGQHLHGTLVSQKITSFLYHHRDGITIEHGEDGCPLDTMPIHPAPRIKGYVLVIQGDGYNRLALFELTDAACQCLEKYTMRPWRGHQIEVWREGTKKNARVFAKIELLGGCSEVTRGLNVDVRQSVRNVWQKCNSKNQREAS
jgi:hypothetical protein